MGDDGLAGALKWLRDEGIPFVKDEFVKWQDAIDLFRSSTLFGLIEELRDQLPEALNTLTNTVIPNLQTKWDEMVASFKRLAGLLGLKGASGEGGDFNLSTAIETLGEWIGTMMDKITAGLDALSSFVYAMGVLRDILDAMIHMDLRGLANILGGLIGGAVGNYYNNNSGGGDGNPECPGPNCHQRGAFRIPRNELAFLHKNEMVVPAKIAAQVRASLTSIPASPVVNNRTNSVSFGDTHINNGMDMRMMEVMAERALMGAL